MARRTIKEPPDLERLGDEIAAVVRREGSLLRSRLAKLGVPKGAQPSVVARLEGKGIEATPRMLRVPLGEQLDARLRDGATLPMRTLQQAVSGGTPRDVAAAAAALVRAGSALLIVRGSALALTRARGDTLGDRDLGALERAMSELVKTLRSARKHRAALLREDVRDLLAPFTSSPDSRLNASTVLAEARSHTLTSGLAFVPALVRALGGPAARDAVHDALRDAAKQGLLELRPESGLGRLSEEDIALCVPGPQGSYLSWARPIAEAR
jgi:hypothetical protein